MYSQAQKYRKLAAKSIGCRVPVLEILFALAQAPGDAPFVQVVGRHLHLYAVSGGEPDELFAHLATDSGEDEMFVIEFHPEHGTGKNSVDAAFHFNVLFFHQLLSADLPALG